MRNQNSQIDLVDLDIGFLSVFAASFLPIPATVLLVWSAIVVLTTRTLIRANIHGKWHPWMRAGVAAVRDILVSLWTCFAFAGAFFSGSVAWLVCVMVALGVSLFVPRLRLVALTVIWLAFGFMNDYWPIAYLPLLLTAKSTRERPMQWKAALRYASIVGMSLVAEARFVPSYLDSVEVIASQKGVQLLAGNSAPGMPRAKMDTFCDPDKSVLQIGPNGSLREHAIGWEASDKSWVEASVWTVFAGDFLYSIRLTDFSIGVSAEIVDADNAFYVLSATDVEYVTANFDLVNACRIYDKSSLDLLAEIRVDGLISYCQPFNAQQVLVSHSNWGLSRQIRIVDWISGKTSVQWNAWPDSWPFYDIAVDQSSQSVWVPNHTTGKLTELSLPHLTEMRSFFIRPGIRGVLVDMHTKLLYSWNYFNGEIIESTREGDTIRRWRLGPLLRNLRWDCDDRYLLAGTNAGVFRIQVRGEDN